MHTAAVRTLPALHVVPVLRQIRTIGGNPEVEPLLCQRAFVKNVHAEQMHQWNNWLRAEQRIFGTEAYAEPWRCSFRLIYANLSAVIPGPPISGKPEIGGAPRNDEGWILRRRNRASLPAPG